MTDPSMGYGSSREIHDQLLSPEDANLSVAFGGPTAVEHGPGRGISL